MQCHNARLSLVASAPHHLFPFCSSPSSSPSPQIISLVFQDTRLPRKFLTFLYLFALTITFLVRSPVVSQALGFRGFSIQSATLGQIVSRTRFTYLRQRLIHQRIGICRVMCLGAGVPYFLFVRFEAHRVHTHSH